MAVAIPFLHKGFAKNPKQWSDDQAWRFFQVWRKTDGTVHDVRSATEIKQMAVMFRQNDLEAFEKTRRAS